MKNSTKRLTLHYWSQREIWFRSVGKLRGSEWKPISSEWRGIMTQRWKRESSRSGISSLDKYSKTPKSPEPDHLDTHGRDRTRSSRCWNRVHTELQTSPESRSEIFGMRSISRNIINRLPSFVIYLCFSSCINRFVIQHLLVKVQQIWYQFVRNFLFKKKKRVHGVDYKLEKSAE